MRQVSSVEKTKQALPRMELRTALLVEDCSALHAPLLEILREFAVHVDVSASCTDAVRRLRSGTPPQLILLDVCLPDGSALDVLDALQGREPMPALVALSGSSDAATAFRLAERGVRAFVPKPVCASRVREAVAQTLTAPPDLSTLARAAVGRIPIHSVEEQVRDTMLSEALAQSGGNRRAAARLLSISRQLLQHMIRTKS